MALLNILQYPDARLHKVAKPVAQVDDRIRKLVADMAETMYEAPGVGLAATQVDVHERVITIDVSESRDELRVFINPEIVWAKLAALALLGLLLLVGFLAVAFGMVYAFTMSVTGSFSPLTTLPAVAYTALELTVLVGLISIGVTILLGSTAAILGRSLSFGIAAAMAFFPADNFGTIILGLMSRITHIDAWSKATAYLLGPNLNLLASKLETGRQVRPAFATPNVAVSTEHVWAVVGVYTAVFLLASIVLLLRRDVLE